ncbi:hypothetical protein [Micromonospora sp. KC213]|uniref:hypothetical protein n=1 Tax=Micromonospora sp. KC213 TaxID=2530378 RepID=UPI001049F260|nr:hypothetical protein [Micromonospora sp. KC213]TDC42076.1 hypothetical protein E1166_08945 [Micromonospora sp. KC213]
MQLDLGDVPAWTALVLSGAAVYVATRANRHARDSAAASKDSAGSARRSADAAERQALAAEAAIPPPPPQVAWRVEWVSKQRYLLRNIGVGTATGVKVEVRNAHPLAGLKLGDGTLESNQSVSFLIMGSMGRPAPTELWVSWDGQEEPIAVAI